MVKAVIFDMDGVIIDSEHLHNDAEKKVMLKYGVSISSEELQNYTGMTDEFMFKDLIKTYDLNASYIELYSLKEKILIGLFQESVQPIRGVIEFLKELKQKNIKLAIGSSSHRKLINLSLKKFNILNMFDVIVSVEDVTHSKPNPELFLKAASMLSLKPMDCAVVEDAKSGVEAAKNAGMKCIGYKNPNSGDQDLTNADIIIDAFSKLDLNVLLQL